MTEGDIIRVREWDISREFSINHISVFSDPQDEMQSLILRSWSRNECGVFLGNRMQGFYGEPMVQVFVSGLVGWVDEGMIEVFDGK